MRGNIPCQFQPFWDLNFYSLVSAYSVLGSFLFLSRGAGFTPIHISDPVRDSFDAHPDYNRIDKDGYDVLASALVSRGLSREL